MANCYRLTAPRSMAKIPKGYVLQVVSSSSPNPNVADVEKALKAAGFTDSFSLSYRSPGNWKVEKL